MLSGQNGILTRANDSKRTSKKGEIREAIDLILTEYILQRHMNDMTIKDFLDSKVTSGELDSVIDNGDGTYTVEKEGYEILVDSNGRRVGDIEKMRPKPQITNIKVVSNSNGIGNEVENESLAEGTLYISFGASIEGGTIKEVACDNGTPAKVGELWVTPITANGTYKYTITGEVKGTEYTTTKEITVKKYALRAGLKVGDYIEYTPDTATAYSKDDLSSAKTGSSSNSADITQDTLKWQILRIYEDGSMDIIGSTTNQYIYFVGALGYNNGVHIMNDICEKLYSKESKGITARSVKIEDIESWLTEAGKTARANYSVYEGGPTYGGETTTQTYTSASKKYYPDLYQYEKGAGINSGVAQTTGIGGSETYSGYTNGITDKTYAEADANGLTVTQTYYKLSFNNTNYGEGYEALTASNSYWVASRCARCYSNNARFGLHYARNYVDGANLFYSSSSTYDSYFCLRPVVSLESNVKITPSSSASSETGTPHQITQY